MERHAAFFEHALARLARRRAPRILVCGAADYWTYARVLEAFRGARLRPVVSVIDLCETPLALNRWYAARAGRAIATQRRDVLTWTTARRFDAICTHALFGRFPPERRTALIAKWRSLLRPGGIIVTVTPVRSGDARLPVAFTAEQAERFFEAMLKAAAARPVGEPAGALAEEARKYAARMRVHRVRSSGELRGLFRRGGLRVEELSPIPPARGAGGPTAAGAAYVRAIARRR